MIAVVDYGVGNLFSIRSALDCLDVRSTVTADAAEITDADAIILPGVGAFADAAAKLRGRGLDRLLVEQVQGGKPLLGICLGMQLLYERSEEFGNHTGLGLLRGTVRGLGGELDPKEYPIPHIGWNLLDIHRDCPILRDTQPGTAVYYVHSFYAPVDEQTAASSTYGTARVSGVVHRGNLYGTQFHPEKSGGAGLAILRAFCNLV